ncbi:MULTISPECIES: DUF2975 domain-containing protein [Methanobacterium]|jgi:hypothetical protein|uniref:DUF2975 domain-containing protein n=1 Tax=Methanobacterium veterum TaxID=408577 RepID=A0A9E5A0B4_9EURY|nr:MULTISPECIES: DUF2975 domain-containing protein [Methanobacterium]MCZ3366818.1 DUF2975 domain-containing protein [Methanobacterium veterum]MCZ3374035.1 DUF2975 domain-containing protein [Methanobacterium veterum]
MERGSTIFLRGLISIMGLAVLVLCILGMYWFANRVLEGELIYLHYAILLGLIIPAVPFFFALYQTLKLLNFIDNNKAFSNLSVNALKNIKYSAVIISILYVICMPVVYLVAKETDAPGFILIGLAITFAPVVIATFAAILERLLKDAIDIKSENDLTV